MRPFLIFFSLSLFFPPAVFGWTGADHRRMTREALEEVSWDWGLKRPCEVRPLQSFLNKLREIRPELVKPREFSTYLKVNPSVDLGAEDSALKGKKFLTPIEILSTYATDADDGRDQDLFEQDPGGGRRYRYPDQVWFGAMEGVNSQAFRHIEKPPFSLVHPLTTFGWPLRAVGEATGRAEIYVQLSLLAFSLREEYWGWRFLAGSLHYLEDLHQPYHAGQITPSLFLKGLRAYLLWGRREKGFLGTFSHLVANLHNFYEVYVSDQGMVRGRDRVIQPGSIQSLAVEVRDQSNRLFPELVAAVTDLTDPILLTSFVFDPDRMGPQQPTLYLNKGPRFEKANQTILTITTGRFRSAGRVIRTAVYEVIGRRESGIPKTFLERLDTLLLSNIP